MTTDPSQEITQSPDHPLVVSAEYPLEEPPGLRAPHPKDGGPRRSDGAAFPAVLTGPRVRVLLPYLALALGALALGMSAIFIKWANAPGPVSGFFRMAIAAPILALPFARQVRRSAPLSRRHVLFAMLAGLFFSGDIASYGTAVLIAPVANITLLGNTAPLWVGIGSMVLFKDRLRPAFWAGLLIALFGVVGIIAQDVLANPHFSVADLLGVISGFCYGMFFLATERARTGLRSLVAWWISAATCGVTLFLVSLVLQLSLVGYPADTYINLAALALVTQIGGWLALNFALGHLKAAVVSPTLLFQPVFTAIVAVPLLGQALTVPQVVGGAIVLAGIFLVHRAQG